MQYLCLIYGSEEHEATMNAEEKRDYYAAYGAFTESVKGSGNLLAGEALQPIATATSVRVRDGKTVLTDGPFAETKEQLGGFYMIEAADLDEATAIAARIPTAKHGTIEVRPILAWE